MSKSKPIRKVTSSPLRVPIPVHTPADADRIRNSHPLLRKWPDFECLRMWSEWAADVYESAWKTVSTARLNEFRRWVESHKIECASRGCSNQFMPKRAWSLYCGKRCAWRERQAKRNERIRQALAKATGKRGAAGGPLRLVESPVKSRSNRKIRKQLHSLQEQLSQVRRKEKKMAAEARIPPRLKKIRRVNPRSFEIGGYYANRKAKPPTSPAG